MNDVANESLGVFFKGFEDCKKRVKELLSDFSIAFLVSSIGTLEETTIVLAEDTAKEAMDVQVIGASIDDPPLTSFKVVAVGEVPEAPVEV